MTASLTHMPLFLYMVFPVEKLLETILCLLAQLLGVYHPHTLVVVLDSAPMAEIPKVVPAGLVRPLVNLD